MRLSGRRFTPYSTKQVVKNAYQLVFNTGIFVSDCWEWNKRAAVDKTLPHLKVFFDTTHREWRLSIQYKTAPPYGATHNTTANPDDIYFQQETVEAIAKLATTTASYRAAIAQLMATVARLATELATVNTKLVVNLQTNRASQGGHRGRGRIIRRRGSRTGSTSSTGTGSSAPEITNAGAPNMAEEKYLEPLIYYCWTCGPGCRHNSAKCPAPETGHIYKSTKRNMQGRAEATK